MQFSCLILVLAVTAVNSKLIDFNDITDIGLDNANEYLRDHKFTAIRIPDGTFGPNVSFTDSVVFGLDSLKRTGNCTLDARGRNTSFDFHFGFGLFQQTFGILNIAGTEMSAGIRIRDNSVRLAFTFYNGRHCHVTLDHLTYERLAGVEFYASRPEFDGLDLDEHFEKVVVPFLNNMIDRDAVEKAMQKICKKGDFEISEHMPFVHMTVIEHLMK